MKILAIHNFHRKGSASGDDQVYISETALLESYGNTIIRYTVSNDEFDQKRVLGKILYTFSMIWSFKRAARYCSYSYIFSITFSFCTLCG